MGSSYLVILIVIIIHCNAQDIDSASKTALVEGILKKIFNLTLNSFSNIPTEEKGKMLNKIEDKLKKSAESLGPKNSKYVSLIMEGIKSVSPEKFRKSNDKWSNQIDDSWNVDKKYLMDSHAKGEMNIKELNSQNKFIQKVANNIYLISSQAFKQAKGSKDREVILNDMKQQIIDSAIRKQKMLGTHGFSQLNSGAIAHMIDKLIKEHGKKNVPRKMEFNYIKNIDVKKDTSAENMQFRNFNAGIKSKGGDNRIEDIPKDILPHIIEPSSQVSLKLPCHNTKKIICESIKSLKSIKCNDESSDREISVQKLCDDIKDCPDYSDERDCTKQGIQKIRSASNIMIDIKKSILDNCSAVNINESLVAEQNEVLQNILENQLKFLEKHKTSLNSSQSTMRHSNEETAEIRSAVNEVALVISSLASALDTTVCVRRIYDDDSSIFRDIYNPLEPLPETTTWTPSSCTCHKQYCTGKCSDVCGLICTQRYSLDRWKCPSVNGMSTIPLDSICDGKPDCFDTSDENGCSTDSGLAKFEADNMYNLVLEMISKKMKSIHYESVRNKLINLQGLVEKLQKLSSIRDADGLKVKEVRKECFSEMVNIYDQIKFYAYSMQELIDWNVFLISLNEKLVSAMKRSNIGNEKSVAAYKCFCRNGDCLLPKCSKVCHYACPAEAKLTRYYCGGPSHGNDSIPLEAICNGHQDCPGGDDEKDCSEDICRKHHIIVLRHNLKKVIKGKIASVDEALRAWNIKVAASESIMEIEERPKRNVLQGIAKTMLEELVMSYATLRINRKSNNDDGMEDFSKVSDVIMKFLKSCTK